MPPPKSAPPKSAYMTSPRSRMPAARTSSTDMTFLHQFTAALLHRTGQQPDDPDRECDVDGQKDYEHRADTLVGRDTVAYRHQPLDDPGLPAELRDHPSGLKCDQPERRGEHDHPQEPFSGWV